MGSQNHENMHKAGPLPHPRKLTPTTHKLGEKTSKVEEGEGMGHYRIGRMGIPANLLRIYNGKPAFKWAPD